MIDHLVALAGHTAVEMLYHEWQSSANSDKGALYLRKSLNLIIQIRNENLVNKVATRQIAVDLVKNVLEELRNPNLALYDLHKRKPHEFRALMRIIAKTDYDFRGPQKKHVEINLALQRLIVEFGEHLIRLGA